MNNKSNFNVFIEKTTLSKESIAIKQYPDEHGEIIKYCNDNNMSDLEFRVKVRVFLDDLLEVPKCENSNCNNKVELLSVPRGFNKFCSRSCKGECDKNKPKAKKVNLVNDLKVSNDLKGKDIFFQNDPSGKYTKEAYVKSNYPNEYVKVMNYCVKNKIKESFKGKMICYLYGYKNVPVCKNPNCNNITEALSVKLGYREYCSNKCLGSDPSIMEKKKKTSLKNYGVEIPQKLDIVKEKAINTNLERYGEIAAILNKDVKKRALDTLMKNYGVDYPSKSKEILDKRVNTFKENLDLWIERKSKTMLSKYGSISIAKNEEYRKKNFKIAQNPNYIKYLGNGISLFKCDKGEGHEFEMSSSEYLSRIKFNTTLCKVCFPIQENRSLGEMDMSNFIKENLSNYNYEIIDSYRDVKEIDVYIKDLNIGFDYNGIYWHSDKHVDKNYHLNKFNHFSKRGIDFYQISEYDWINNNEVCKSFILSKLGIYQNNIDSNKCNIIIVDDDKAKEFLEKNNINGYIRCDINIGLEYNSELFYLLSLNKIDDDYTIVRYTNKLFSNVDGALNRIIDYLLINYEFEFLVVFLDNDYSNSSKFLDIGFSHVLNIEPDKINLDNIMIYNSGYRCLVY